MKLKTFALLFIFVLFFSILTFGIEKTDKDKILASDPEWTDIYQNYRTDSKYIEILKTKIDEHLRIDVYLGLWCPDSRNNVPVFMRILDSLDIPNINVNYYNCERKASKDIKYYVEDLKVERVPTFIFYRDGKEIGRIVENPKKSLAEDFMEIVF